MNTTSLIKIGKKVEPVIITYNRAALLKETLAFFMQAGFSNIKMHVLDNASTDHTKIIIRSFQENWPQLIYHGNEYNIGGNGNILRAIELSKSEYHWVIGDDDTWSMDHNNINELANTLEQCEADILRLGWLVPKKHKGILKNGLDLIKEENLFFCSVSMISSVIVKRSIMNRYLPQAYQNIGDSYPQLVPLIRSLEEQPIKVYSLSTDLIHHTPSKSPNYFLGDLEWFACWFRTSRFFTHEKLQKKFINEAIIYLTKETSSLKHLIHFMKRIIYFKSFYVNQTPYLFSMIAYGKGQRIPLVILFMFNGLFPRWIAKILRRIYYGKAKKLHFDRSRL